MKMQFFLIALLLFTTNYTNAQSLRRPKSLKIQGEYYHSQTGTRFPDKIGVYSIKEGFAFNKQKTNIGISYEYNDNTGNTTLTIYLYPAGIAVEGRLRSEYLSSMQQIASTTSNGLNAKQYHSSFEKDGYRINGFKADLKNYPEQGVLSQISLYECAKWFFKVRITSTLLDSISCANINRTILDSFLPTNLVRMDPLNHLADIHFAPAAFADSILLGSAMGSVFTKMEWAIENVDSLERAAGFPDLYLDMHIAALKEFAKFEKEHNYSMVKSTADYLNQLKTIVESDYLAEFILDQYSMVMIIPTDHKIDFEGYENWMIQNNITLNLNEMLYVIEYSDK